MGEKINTGNYRVCRHKPGIGGSIEILETGDKATVDAYWSKLEKDNDYTYYREEEVYYKGTMTDGKNEINSAPAYIRISE